MGISFCLPQQQPPPSDTAKKSSKSSIIIASSSAAVTLSLTLSSEGAAEAGGGGGGGGGRQSQLDKRTREEKRMAKMLLDHITSPTLCQLREDSSKSGRRVEDIYEIGKDLGKGAFSVVKEGVHRVTGHTVAIKFLPLRNFVGKADVERSVSNEIEAMQRINRFAQAIQEKDSPASTASDGKNSAVSACSTTSSTPPPPLPHSSSTSTSTITTTSSTSSSSSSRTSPNYVNIESDASTLMKLEEVHLDDQKLSLVLEHLSGGELFYRIVEKGKYTERDASKVMCRLIHGLRALHSHGIIHRDMKPENCIYAAPQCDLADIKITDFGLALLFEGPAGTRRERRLVGTPGYLAPEVLTKQEYGPACDVWSTGVVMYILLAGYPPFFGADKKVMFECIKQGRYFFHEAAWANVSAEAKDLVRRMLVVDVTKRITVDKILEHPWISQVNCNLPDAHLGGAVERIKTFNAKRKWRAAIIACTWGGRYKHHLAGKENGNSMKKRKKRREEGEGDAGTYLKQRRNSSDSVSSGLRTTTTGDSTRTDDNDGNGKEHAATVMRDDYDDQDNHHHDDHDHHHHDQYDHYHHHRDSHEESLMNHLQDVVGHEMVFTSSEIARIKDCFVKTVSIDHDGINGVDDNDDDDSDGDGAGGRNRGASAVAAVATGGNGDGSSHGACSSGVRREQFKTMMEEDLGFTDLPLDRLFDLFDRNGNGVIDYNEFITGLGLLRRPGEDAFRFVFNIYDVDSSGQLTLDELKHTLHIVYGGGHEEKEAAARAAALFAALDVGDKGFLTFEEFKAGVEKEHSLVDAFLKPIINLGPEPIVARTGLQPVRSPSNQTPVVNKKIKAVLGVEVQVSSLENITVNSINNEKKQEGRGITRGREMWENSDDGDHYGGGLGGKNGEDVSDGIGQGEGSSNDSQPASYKINAPASKRAVLTINDEVFSLKAPSSGH